MTAVPYDPAKHCGAHPDHPDKGPCRAVKGSGTDHPGIGCCKHHGGSTPNQRAAAERESLARDARALGVPEHVPPAEGLLAELAQTLGELRWLRTLIVLEGEKDPESLWRGTRSMRRTESPDGTVISTEAGPVLSVKMQTYERWKRHYRELAAVVIGHDLVERQIEAAEQQAETMGALVAAALDALGAKGDDRVRAIEAARDQFTLINSGVA
jgi:predicted secreted protein